METEKDLIKREIQKLTLVLNRLIEKISEMNSVNAKSSISEVNEILQTAFDLTLDKIVGMETSELIKHISPLQESHTEKIVELIIKILLKTTSLNLEIAYKKTELAQKGIIIIDFLNDRTKTFSMKRMHMKNSLLQNYN